MPTEAGTRSLVASLAADPLTSVAVHYGMLLGVPDFELLMANPRGKLRLHNGWLHGPGVVWGYEVTYDQPASELRVGPGLALDGPGRELALTVPACVDLAQWYGEHGEDLTTTPVAGGVTLDLRLVARYVACLARPVPAIASGCEGSGSETAFSRVLETVELLLVQPEPEPPGPKPFDSLRRLLAFGDTGVAGDRARIEALPEEERQAAWLEAWRRRAAEEVTALEPPGLDPATGEGSAVFPGEEPYDVVLADLPGVRVLDGADGGHTVEVPTIDLAARRSHVPTQVTAELLAELLTRGGGAGAGGDAGGPRAASWSRAGTTVTIALTGDLAEDTLDTGLSVTLFDPAASPVWATQAVTHVYTAAQPGPPAQAATLEVELPSEPTGPQAFRLVLRGTGDTPVVGLVDGAPVPFAGIAGGPPGSPDDGHDFAIMIKEATP